MLKHKKFIVFATATLLLSGQFSAFASICPMPDMHMTMDLMTSDESMNTESFGDASEALSANGMPDSSCEQICGYCVSFSFPLPLPKEWAEVRNYTALPQSAPCFVPTAGLENPFRPPITA